MLITVQRQPQRQLQYQYRLHQRHLKEMGLKWPSLFLYGYVHVPTGKMLTGLTDPQLRHACIQEGLILGMGSVALDGNNSAAAINKYGNSIDHCLTTPTPEYTFKVK